MVVLSLLLVSKGFEASAHGRTAAPILVNPDKVSTETPAPAAPTDPAVVRDFGPARPRSPSFRDLANPSDLRRLVANRAAHPRPIGAAVECIARTVYLEAANQELTGQLAVAQVIVNRMRASAYPKSACAVVGQHGQFAYGDVAVDPTSAKPWDTAVAIASIAAEGLAPQVAPGALFFHADYVKPAWSQEHERIAQIGDHIFYR